MKIETFSEKKFELEVWYHIGTYENSIHFIFDHATKTCALVDPAWEADRFIQHIKDKGYTLTQIWVTHWHGDHIGAVDEVHEKTGAQIFVGINEVPYLELDSPYTTIEDHETLTLGETAATVINTPGHTAGGVCYLLDNHLIAGDSLFVYGAGHCELPGGDMRTFFHSLHKLKQLDDQILLHCGHDYGVSTTSTMGEQKAGNAFLLLDNEEDFVRYMQGMKYGQIAYPTGALTKAEVDALL